MAIEEELEEAVPGCSATEPVDNNDGGSKKDEFIKVVKLRHFLE